MTVQNLRLKGLQKWTCQAQRAQHATQGAQLVQPQRRQAGFQLCILRGKQHHQQNDVSATAHLLGQQQGLALGSTQGQRADAVGNPHAPRVRQCGRLPETQPPACTSLGNTHPESGNWF